MPMKSPPHPGRIVRQDCIEALELTVTRAAKLLGVTRQTLNNLINEKAGISPEMAIRLEKLGWSTADQWIRLQAAYDLAQSRQRQDKIKVRAIRTTPRVSQTVRLGEGCSSSVYGPLHSSFTHTHLLSL